MCWFSLDVCPYPHQGPISALIFDPIVLKRWKHCDRVQPWGRLSCGHLTVEHPTTPARQQLCPSLDHALASLSNIAADAEQHKPLSLAARPRRSSTESTVVPVVRKEEEKQAEPCLWCTAVLKTVATKSKEIQTRARHEIDELERKMDASPELRTLHEVIKHKEAELDALRDDAWNMRSRMIAHSNGTCEETELVEAPTCTLPNIIVVPSLSL